MGLIGLSIISKISESNINGEFELENFKLIDLTAQP